MNLDQGKIMSISRLMGLLKALKVGRPPFIRIGRQVLRLRTYEKFLERRMLRIR